MEIWWKSENFLNILRSCTKNLDAKIARSEFVLIWENFIQLTKSASSNFSNLLMFEEWIYFLNLLRFKIRKQFFEKSLVWYCLFSSQKWHLPLLRCESTIDAK